MNNVQIIGRLTRDIEIRTTQSNKKVARFTLAVNRKGDGVDFIPCQAWDKTAEILSKYVGKGRQIGVCGRISSGSYEKDGRKINTLDVIVNEFDFADSKPNETKQNQQEAPKKPAQAPTPQKTINRQYEQENLLDGFLEDDEDLPFK